MSKRKWGYVYLSAETLAELEEIRQHENAEAKELNDYAREHPNLFGVKSEPWNENRTLNDVIMSVFVEGLHARLIAIGDQVDARQREADD